VNAPSLGTVTLIDREHQLTKGAWRIQCAPHVMIRLKRVFERISKGEHGSVLLSDTTENARELEWFLARYKMDVDPAKYLRKRAQEHRLREASVARSLDPSYTPPAFDLAIPPREYQRRAADMLLKSGGLLLADDVGLGKSAVAICTFMDKRTLPAVVVTLTHLPRQWAAEIGRFAPALKVYVVKNGKAFDLWGKGQSSPDVVVINYHKLSAWAETLAPRVSSIVFDEVQELRTGSGSQKYAAAIHISERVSFRTGLSATPVFNYGGEIYNVMSALVPDALGTHAEFSREWCNGNGQGEHVSVRDPKGFGTYLREQGLMLRRTRAEVGRELPPLTKVPHVIDADLDAIEKVSGSAAELARIILAQKGMTERGAKFRAAEEFSMILRQATGIAKAPYVAAFVRLLVESGEKVVLFGWHRDVYAIYEEKLKGLDPVFYTGAESPTQKEAARRAFVEGDAKVLVMSLRAGAGLDGLQGHSNIVVFGELDFSPAVHEQNTGRVYRDGQAEPVIAYYLISESGSDPIIADILGLKRTQIYGMRDPNANLVEALGQTGEKTMRMLAADFLRQRGMALPEESVAS